MKTTIYKLTFKQTCKTHKIHIKNNNNTTTQKEQHSKHDYK